MLKRPFGNISRPTATEVLFEHHDRRVPLPRISKDDWDQVAADLENDNSTSDDDDKETVNQDTIGMRCALTASELMELIQEKIQHKSNDDKKQILKILEQHIHSHLMRGGGRKTRKHKQHRKQRHDKSRSKRK
jgi:hypothetical protein